MTDPLLLITPIESCRGWRLTDDDHLRSLSLSIRWPPGSPLVAECYATSDKCHKTPTFDSDWSRHQYHVPCGIYGMKDFADPIPGFWGADDIIAGKVSQWGRIIEHEAGYRAEYAYPLELFVPRCACSTCLRIRGRATSTAVLYGIEVVESAQCRAAFMRPAHRPVGSRVRSTSAGSSRQSRK